VPESMVRRVAAFAFDQFPRLVPLILPFLPARWMEMVGGKTYRLAIGNSLFQRDYPVQALQFLQRSLRAGRASIDENLLQGMCLFQGLGRFRDAKAFFARANELAVAEAAKRGLADTPFRVLDSIWARHIGHTATLDYVIKLGILEGRPREDTILYVPRGSVIANRFLLQQMAEHLRLVENPADLPFDAAAVQPLHYDYLGPRLPDGTTAYYWEAAGKTYERWQHEGRGPLLTFPPDLEARGWAVLQGAGVPQGAWFVALHVREGKWDGRSAGLHGNVLNADIATYRPAIEEITRRGGWVIRMGGPDMTPLAPSPNVFDYCHSRIRSDWMDVFIAARCKFMLATSSGPAYIPPLYGVPAVLTNWWPHGQRPWHASDIFVPKMLRRIADGSYLTLSETLGEPFAWCHSLRYLADNGVRVEDNEPQIILAAVEEMMARLDGKMGHDATSSTLRTRADQIYAACGIFGTGQLADRFIRQYSDIIR
jgi:putative glycosyltransferase (TIGR04372 family)